MNFKKYLGYAAVYLGACAAGAGIMSLCQDEPKKPELEEIVMKNPIVRLASNTEDAILDNIKQGKFECRNYYIFNDINDPEIERLSLDRRCINLVSTNSTEKKANPKKQKKENIQRHEKINQQKTQIKKKARHEKSADLNAIAVASNHQRNIKKYYSSYNISADHAVVVSKREQRAYLFNLDNLGLEKKYIVSTAEKSGPKMVIGDNKTPEGFFKVTGVKEKDGAIGPYAVYYDYIFSEDRINNGVLGTPMHGIKSYRLGQPASHGCTRFSRSDIADLVKYINRNDLVIIYAGPENPKEILIKYLKRLN